MKAVDKSENILQTFYRYTKHCYILREIDLQIYHFCGGLQVLIQLFWGSECKFL